MRMRFLPSIVAFFVLCIGIILFCGYFVIDIYKKPSALSNDTYMIVNKGDGLDVIAQTLYDKNVIDYPIIIKLMTYYQGVHTKIKAGEYVLHSHISPQEAINQMVSGDIVTHKITIIEGKTVSETLAEIKKNDLLTGDINRNVTEGSLLPETYLFERNTERDALIMRMQNDQKKFLDEQWKNRADNLPITSQNEALILASIVEKETGLASERKIIASVFINRLRKAMRLQSDPTIIYGMTKGKFSLSRPLYRSDILNPQDGYNTYVIDRLPPTPICNPSKESVIAVLNPADTDYLFFVANGTGGHSFSKTLQSHNNNVQKWRVIEKTKQQ